LPFPVGALDDNVGAGSDGEADIRLRECRRVVDAIADHFRPKYRHLTTAIYALDSAVRTEHTPVG
jgi:hypothetical protein